MHTGSRSLDTEGHSLATSDAEGGEPLLGLPSLHLMKERDEHTATRGSDRVPESDGATVDIDDGGIEAQFSSHSEGLSQDQG